MQNRDLWYSYPFPHPLKFYCLQRGTMDCVSDLLSKDFELSDQRVLLRDENGRAEQAVALLTAVACGCFAGISNTIYSSGFQPFCWSRTPRKHFSGSRNPCAIIQLQKAAFNLINTIK